MPTIYHRFVYILPRYDLFWWLAPEKIAFGLQRSGTKYRYFIWAKRSTSCQALGERWWFALRAAMRPHLALISFIWLSSSSISLLLASFDVALPSESRKPSWIDWTIEISPSTRWFLLGWFPARRSRFRVSRRATYCARRSSTLYRPVVHTSRRALTSARAFAAATCSAGPCARRSRSSTFWRCASQWVPLHAASWSY